MSVSRDLSDLGRALQVALQGLEDEDLAAVAVACQQGRFETAAEVSEVLRGVRRLPPPLTTRRRTGVILMAATAVFLLVLAVGLPLAFMVGSWTRDGGSSLAMAPVTEAPAQALGEAAEPVPLTPPGSEEAPRAAPAAQQPPEALVDPIVEGASVGSEAATATSPGRRAVTSTSATPASTATPAPDAAPELTRPVSRPAVRPQPVSRPDARPVPQPEPESPMTAPGAPNEPDPTLPAEPADDVAPGATEASEGQPVAAEPAPASSALPAALLGVTDWQGSVGGRPSVWSLRIAEDGTAEATVRTRIGADTVTIALVGGARPEGAGVVLDLIDVDARQALQGRLDAAGGEGTLLVRGRPRATWKVGRP